MGDVTIHGFPQSTYVRTVRMACEEKGVSYDVEPVEFGSAGHLALHPFGRIPALTHGDNVIYETGAIARYVDAAFDGPALQPAEAAARARMDQWISVLCDYCYQDMIRGLVFPRIVTPSRGGEADEDLIAESLPKIETGLEVLDAALGRSEYLAGDAISLADLFALPILFYLRLTPEGAERLPAHEALGRWWERVNARPSALATVPPLPGRGAA